MCSRLGHRNHLVNCVVGSRHSLMIKRNPCRGSIHFIHRNSELGKQSIKSPLDADSVESPYSELDTGEGDSWLNDDRVKTYGETIKGILNRLSAYTNEEEEWSKLWSNLSNVNTAGRAIAQGLEFVQQWNKGSFNSSGSVDVFEKLKLELDATLRNMQVHCASVLEERARKSRVLFFKEARKRRRKMLELMDKPKSFQFDNETTLAIWKKWQADLIKKEFRRTGVYIKRPRHKFESYCHHAIKGVGESAAPSKHLALLVIRTGGVNDDLERELIANRSRQSTSESVYDSGGLRKDPPCGLAYNVRTAPFRTAVEFLKPMVIAVDSRTEYCQWLVCAYPSILNCCVVVRGDLCEEWYADSESFDVHEHEDVRARMKEQLSWGVLREAARYIFELYGVVLVLCNYGKHQSLSLGYEIARDADCEFVAPCVRSYCVDPENILDLLRRVAPRLKVHAERFGNLDHPIRAIGVCRRDFDGPEWMNGHEHELINPEDMHVLHRKDLVIGWRNPVEVVSSWSLGTVIRGSVAYEGLWFPPFNVLPISKYFFPRVRDVEEILLRQWNGSELNKYFESGMNEHVKWIPVE